MVETDGPAVSRKRLTMLFAEQDRLCKELQRSLEKVQQLFDDIEKDVEAL